MVDIQDGIGSHGSHLGRSQTLLVSHFLSSNILTDLSTKLHQRRSTFAPVIYSILLNFQDGGNGHPESNLECLILCIHEWVVYLYFKSH